MYHKCISFRKYQRTRTINRKFRILKMWDMDEKFCKGKLNKGKIHCSCMECQRWRKSKYVGLPVSEKRKLIQDKQDIQMILDMMEQAEVLKEMKERCYK